MLSSEIIYYKSLTLALLDECKAVSSNTGREYSWVSGGTGTRTLKPARNKGGHFFSFPGVAQSSNSVSLSALLSSLYVDWLILPLQAYHGKKTALTGIAGSLFKIP